MDIVTYALCRKYVEASLLGAGALKGQKGDPGKDGKNGAPGKSAFEIAVANGYKGSEAEWLEKLQGKDGYTPYIGENGNWFINGGDTNIPGRAIRDYSELENLPKVNGKELSGELSLEDLGINIPTKVSQLDNDAGYITADEVVIPTKVSDFDNDAGYLTLNDVSDFVNKTELDEVKGTIPTKTSQLTNDSKFLTAHQKIKTINGQNIIGIGNVEVGGKIDDVQVNGVSVVKDKVANITIDIPELNAEIGYTFTTNTTVGHLEEGTPISKNMTVGEILYKILYTDIIVKNGYDLYWGGLEQPETGLVGLDHAEQNLGMTDAELTTGTQKVVIKTGNVDTEDGEYPTVILTKGEKNIKLVKWISEGMEAFPYQFVTVEKEDCYIYYIPTLNYTEDSGGATFVLTFAEV